jgi:hypothetical protein
VTTTGSSNPRFLPGLRVSTKKQTPIQAHLQASQDWLIIANYKGDWGGQSAVATVRSRKEQDLSKIVFNHLLEGCGDRESGRYIIWLGKCGWPRPELFLQGQFWLFIEESSILMLELMMLSLIGHPHSSTTTLVLLPQLMRSMISL